MPRKYHALKVPKPRQSWSKYNLYNLSRLQVPQAANRTFFQQKWTAKALARAYHNPYVREGQWTRMFDRRLPAVVPMDFKYLARSDGSEFAAGRGMGLQEDGEVQGVLQEGREGAALGRAGRRRERTPYMHMAFHPLERRLDTAVWRALFASSSKQARQFVVHGWVRVNGKKMTYPGYLLNPGDMFQVDPGRVMFATGARKNRRDSPVAQARPGEEEEEEADEEEEEVDLEASERVEGEPAALEPAAEDSGAEKLPEQENDAKKALKSLMLRARRILDDSKTDLSAKRLQELRAFSKSVRKTLSKYGSRGAEDTDTSDTIEELESSLKSITSRIPSETLASSPADPSSPAPASSNPQTQNTTKEDAYRARKDAELLHQALQRARENPIDATKPYATPWRPRDYMSAFAFIPRYLEVNQNICSAVYLRHPVARPGLAEVPNPLHPETMGLAFNWYLRRR